MKKFQLTYLRRSQYLESGWDLGVWIFNVNVELPTTMNQFRSYLSEQGGFVPEDHVFVPLSAVIEIREVV